jgi:hypothetical protein
MTMTGKLGGKTGRLVEVYRAENGIVAHLLKGALNDAGIAAHVFEESFATLEARPLWWASPRIMVDAVDSERAIAVISEVESSRANRRAVDGK